MKSRTALIGVGVVCFAMGSIMQRLYDGRRASPARVAQSPNAVATPPPPTVPLVIGKDEVPSIDRSKIDFSKQPLWAWGRTEPAKPLDESRPISNPPGRTLRPNEDPAEQQRIRHVDGGKNGFSLVDVRDAANVVDWFPEDHPNPIPDIIKRGPAASGPEKRACGNCHLTSGQGRPENASPAGLPAAYLYRQLQDFRNGLRHNADPRKSNSKAMIAYAKTMTESEMREAADYFAAARWIPNLKVIETKFVPKTKFVGEIFVATSKELTEPIDGRIIEVPSDPEQSEELRNPHATWIAYVPVGAIKKGKDLVTLGGMKIVRGEIVQGKTTACSTCHGKDLMGVPPDMPGLLGRSPSYLAREMFDIQQGARTGSNSNVQLMRLAIEQLTPEDIVNITAYLASQMVPARPNTQTVALH